MFNVDPVQLSGIRRPTDNPRRVDPVTQTDKPGRRSDSTNAPRKPQRHSSDTGHGRHDEDQYEHSSEEQYSGYGDNLPNQNRKEEQKSDHDPQLPAEENMQHKLAQTYSVAKTHDRGFDSAA